MAYPQGKELGDLSHQAPILPPLHVRTQGSLSCWAPLWPPLCLLLKRWWVVQLRGKQQGNIWTYVCLGCAHIMGKVPWTSPKSLVAQC